MMLTMAFADVALRHFVALRTVAQEGSFGRAAARLGYTQSAVSQQIAALERAVGAAVFDRPGGPRPVTLTAVGELLLDHARALEQTLSCAEDDLRRLLAGQLGRIAVGTFQSVSVAVLPGMVRILRTERPDLEVELFESDDGDVLAERLRNGQLDLSFIVDAWEDGLDGCELEVLHTDPFVLVSPRSPAPSSTVEVRELAGIPLIGQPANQCQFLIDQGLRQHGIEPDYVFRSADNSAVQAMVKAGMGEAVMPLLAVDVHDPEIVVRTIRPGIEPRRIGIAWRSGRTISPAAAAFIELARAAFAAVPVPGAGLTGTATAAERGPPSADGDLDGVEAGGAVGNGRPALARLRLAGGVGGPHPDLVVAGGGIPPVNPLDPAEIGRHRGQHRLRPLAVVDLDLDLGDPPVRCPRHSGDRGAARPGPCRRRRERRSATGS